jgi:beta-glucosidase
MPPFADPANGTLSTKLTAESMTLLKNEGGLLPLTKGQGTIAVIGPHADTVMTYFPGYTFPGALAMFEAMAAARASAQDESGMAGLTDRDTMMSPDVIAAIMAEMRPVMEAGGTEPYVRQQYGSETVLDAVRRVAGKGTLCCTPQAAG